MDDVHTGVTVTGVETPSLFTGPEERPSQVVRVGVRRSRPVGPLVVSLAGPQVETEHPRWLRADSVEAYAGVDAASELSADRGGVARDETVEVSVDLGGAAPGTRLPATVRVTTPGGLLLASRPCELLAAEPGWTVRLVPHFHYDPLWWNTQAAYTSQWDAPVRDGEPEKGWEYAGVPAFTLVPLHLQQARDDPAYRFVLSEIDYLKPFWDTHPEYRDEMRQLITEGRLEIVGGTYNEPSTNLTSAETTVRSALHGLRFHRDVLGSDPRTAWQLDVFGHDPGFPSLMAGAGLDSAVLARGPYHQWGPMMDTWGAALRPPTAMQLPSEYEWIGPGGGPGLLLHYLPAHYSAGWFSHAEPDAEAAAAKILELFELLRQSATTRNVLIPMGTDFSWPHPWGLAVQREWTARYTWPKLEHATPRDHFAAVRDELAGRGESPLPVTREMGPVYTGKDVSYADVKQAHRAAENLVQEAETLAALAYAHGRFRYPQAALDKSWRHLLHAAHHDAVTGTFSDQVYLDLLPTWREAYELASGVRESALDALVGEAVGSSVTVVNALSWNRTDVVRVELPGLAARAGSLAVRDETGALVPVLVEGVSAEGAVTIAFLAADVPGLGQRTWSVTSGETGMSEGWTVETGAAPVVRNGLYEVEADPARGGGLCRVTQLADGRELLAAGEVDALVVQDEYPAHPFFEEGPWHLLPKGPGESSESAPADSVRVERCPIGVRIVASGRTGPVAWTRTTTLWDGVDRVELATRIDGFAGSDQLVRLRVPVDVPGAQPVAETATAAVGRGFAFPEADTGVDHTRAPWTLDTPCLNWFGLTSMTRASLTGPDGTPAGVRTLGAGEIVLPDAGPPEGLRECVTALGALGVTTTPTRSHGPRWGDLAVDSSLPDFRLALGGPDANAFTAGVLAAADPVYTDAVKGGAPVVWVPALRPLRETWLPGCDLTGVRDLPVLVLTGSLAEFTDTVVREHLIEGLHPLPTEGAQEHADFEDRTVALLVRGTPGCAVDTRGRLHSSLLRSCTGRPSGAWMDPPRRTAPDGSSFQLQHWTHEFAHALLSGAGDWRDLDLVRRGREFNAPMTARVTSTAPGAERFLAVEGLMAETVKRTADGGVAVRLREARGRTTTGFVRAPFPVAAAARADLLDVPHETLAAEPGEGAYDDGACGGGARGGGAYDGGAYGGGAYAMTLGGNQWTTLHLTLPDGPRPTVAHQEAARPGFSRYWLHNTGTAPLGDAPYAVTVTPSEVTVASGGPAGEAAVTVHAPSGWVTSLTRETVTLEAGGHVRLPFSVRPPQEAAPGDHLVRVTAEFQDGTAVEDSLTVTVAGHDPSVPGITVTVPEGPVRIAAGASTPLPVHLSNTLRGAVRCEAILVSPYGGWQLAGPRSCVVDVPADGTAEARFTLHPPVDTAPGTYWVLVKAVGQGRVAYSAAVDVRVEEPLPPHPEPSAPSPEPPAHAPEPPAHAPESPAQTRAPERTPAP
ncbi:NEW3 domain-containing protein [Streptomyces sp. NBC_00237]|uniref:glycoside hydrolase family 38 N-terminal domain-containing protein n=1 Tax=Streptomyces sp. NBC_00237 TaxID=2975687 RepID=UPI0022586A22|nr:NEW3 domain-containing protein [Streptomyces sp. NBC_00237]MCX5203444.1 NEW3 domain-containing protein [Streptomyces sp. NBC_00237]